MVTPLPPIDWPWPTNQIAVPTCTAENHPRLPSGAASQPTRAGRMTTAHVPIAASAPERIAADRAREVAETCGGLDS